MMPAVAGLFGVFLVLLATSTFGPGVSPDSAAYLSAAESVAAGRGYVKFDDELYAHLPPLYPTVLAAGVVLGLDAVTVARLLNALAFGLIVFAGSVLVDLHARSRGGVILGVCALLISPTLFSASTMAWSEPFFTLLLVLVAVWLRRHSLAGRYRDLLIAAGCAALACLQRYAGIFVVMAAVIVIVSRRDPTVRVTERVRQAFVFVLVALSPIALWVVRNIYVTGASSFPLNPVGLDPIAALSSAVGVFTGWAFPPRWPLPLRIAGAAIVVAFGWLVTRRVGAGPAEGEDWKARLRVPLILAAVYSVCIFAIILTIHNETSRLLGPTYPWMIVLTVVAFEEGLRRLRGGRRVSAVVTAVMVTACVIWLGYQASRIVRDVGLDVRHGVGPYRRVFQRSATLARIRTSPSDGPLYSNAPEVIYLFTGQHARFGPARHQALAGFASSEPCYLVWLERVPVNIVLSPDELARVFAVTPIARLTDGAVYRVGPLRRSSALATVSLRHHDRERHSRK